MCMYMKLKRRNIEMLCLTIQTAHIIEVGLQIPSVGFRSTFSTLYMFSMSFFRVNIIHYYVIGISLDT